MLSLCTHSNKKMKQNGKKWVKKPNAYCVRTQLL